MKRVLSAFGVVFIATAIAAFWFFGVAALFAVVVASYLGARWYKVRERLDASGRMNRPLFAFGIAFGVAAVLFFSVTGSSLLHAGGHREG